MYRNVFDTELESELVNIKTQDSARIHGTLVWRGDRPPAFCRCILPAMGFATLVLRD
jgi:hypothetical protein